MAFTDENVSADPGSSAVPTPGPQPGGGEAADVPQSPVVGGLEAEADDPDTAEPLEHPQELVGERSARGSVENPA